MHALRCAVSQAIIDEGYWLSGSLAECRGKLEVFVWCVSMSDIQMEVACVCMKSQCKQLLMVFGCMLFAGLSHTGLYRVSSVFACVQVLCIILHLLVL